MKTILFVYHASNIGGGTYCLLNILKEINRQKYKPIVLLGEDGDLVKELNLLGIEVFFMPTMTLVPYNQSLLSRGVLYTYWKIEKSLVDFEFILKKVKPDAVYFNTMMLSAYLEIAKRNGCKTAIHLREHWPLNEHKKQLLRIQNQISTYADIIVAINNYSASLIPNREVTIVHDWIDLSHRYEYRPLDEFFGEDVSRCKIYLFTGGLQDIKGAAEVVEAFINLIPEKDKRLLMVGVAPHPNRNGLKNKVRFLLSKIGINVYEYRVRKMISSDSRICCIPATYAITHIMQQAYCNLSFFTIPHANLALAESIILGTIPVAARTPESIEYSNNGELAVLFEMGNQHDMVSKLKYLDSNYDKILDKIITKKHCVENKFDKMKNLAVLEEVLESMFKTK